MAGNVGKPELGRRFQTARRRANFTQTELATAMGEILGHEYDRSNISHYERGTHPMSAEKLAIASTLMGVSGDFVLGLSDDPTSAGDRMTRSIEDGFVEYVPIYREAAMAGIKGGNVSSLDTGVLPFRRFRLDEERLDPSYLRVFRVIGRSMEPAIYDGAAVLVDYKQTELQDDKVYVIRTDGYLMVKRARRYRQWELISDNPDPMYPPIRCDETIEVWGRVIWASRVLR